MKLKPILLLTFMLLNFHNVFAQDLPFQKGVNLTTWFQTDSPRSIHLYKYQLKDFEQIKSLGCDVIRLPINLHFMTDGAPDYNIDPLFFRLLDSAVHWAEQTDMHLIIDNHTFDPAVDTDPAVGDVLKKVWPQVAAHYVDGYEKLYYEILNEPHGIAEPLWNSIQEEVINTIRQVDTTHMIIVGGADWNGYNSLADIPEYEDDKLIYTFHFYDPFIFTHQGATWTGPSLGNLANVPFPYDAQRMPVFPGSLRGSWVEWLFDNYNQQGTVEHIQELLDIAVAFKNSRNVPVFCGEFGVFIPSSNNDDRVEWYQQVRTYLEANDIAWTSWDYHEGFGLFEPGGNDLFEHDLNIPLIKALGFNEPEQTPFSIVPDQEGIQVYDDFIGQDIVASSYSSGELNYYEQEEVYVGTQAIYWEGASQYDVIGFDFRPNKDFSGLRARNFVLELWVRGEVGSTKFDIRFVDTKTSDTDRPWRMKVTIDQNDVSMDGQWHKLTIPFSEFEDIGAWDGQWYPSRGLFDWSAIDKLEIVAEHGNMVNQPLWFDEIAIKESQLTNTNDITEEMAVKTFPNPTSDFLNIQTANEEKLTLELLDSQGKLLNRSLFQNNMSLNLKTYNAGWYSLSITGKNFTQTRRILVVK
ncbi:MAG: cellulase family glycosylhydrolase [Bacteroidota bacterium]